RTPVKGLPSAVRLSRRACAAATQLSVAVVAFAKWQAAAGLSLPAGIAQALPLAYAIGSPFLSLTVSKAMVASGDTSLSTFRYHCSMGMAPRTLLANWLPEPKKSA